MRPVAGPHGAASASAQQAACARGYNAAGQARAAVRTLVIAASLSTRRRRGLLPAPSGGNGDGADAVGMSALAPLVTVSAVTFWRSRKVARNVLR